MNKTLLGILAISMVVVLGAGAITAYQGNPSIQGPYYNEERHEAIQQTFENLDYDSWKDLMAENNKASRIMQIVTEENFATFVEAHNAAIAGDFDKANELRASLGLNNGQGPKDGTGFKAGKGMRQGLGQGSGMKGQGNYRNSQHSN